MHRIRTIANHCPPPLEGAGGGRGAAGRWGWSANTVQPETQATGEGDVPPPSPSSPSPRGVISRRYTARERDPLSAVNAITLTEIPFPLPVHCIRGYHPILPAPLRGREEAAVAAGRWGCFRRLKHRHSGTPRQGRYSPDTDPPVPGENPPSSPVHPRRATSQPSGPQSSLTLKPVFPDPPVICRPILSSGLPPDLRLTMAAPQPTCTPTAGQRHFSRSRPNGRRDPFPGKDSPCRTTTSAPRS